MTQASGGDDGNKPGDTPKPPRLRPPLRVVRPSDPTWQSGLLFKRASNGSEARTLRQVGANASTIFANDTRWSGIIAFDELSQCVVTRKPPPWHHDDCARPQAGEWSEVDTIRAQSWLSRAWSLDLGIAAVEGAIRAVAADSPVHPIRDWLASLEHDTIPRLDTWLTSLLGVEDTPYARAVGRAFMISAVARVMDPGCKVDTMLVLEGDQGIRKSSALRALVGDAWFVEVSGAIDPKETPQLLRGKWLAEFSELSAFKRTREAETIKGFLSRPVDTFRAPYARASRDYPRQWVCAGTTNEAAYLQDATGARRFWPVRCGVTTAINLRNVEIERAQLWAEALLAYQAGEPWYLVDDALIASARAEQDERYEEDPWMEDVRFFASPRSGTGVTAEEILSSCLSLEASQRDGRAAVRVGHCLRRMGWAPKGKARPRRYHPPAR